MIPVIVVEDEAPFRETVCDFLAMRGFSAVGVTSEKALEGVLEAPAEGQTGVIVLLDVNLGRESGFAIARRLRGRDPAIGIIMLTARDDAEDQIAGLGAGADIYLTKPVDLRTLEANIASLSRRLVLAAAEVAEAPATWALDPASWKLVAPNGGRVDLTAAERAFLAALLDRAGETVGFSDLVQATGGVDDHQAAARLAVLVNRLRRKVERETGYPLPVRSVRSTGYSLTVAGRGGAADA
ncbi:MAG: response regulator transcription factor [Hyphomicrobium sp.]|jgi:DNA-binding response OmpR family regulator